VSDEDKRIAEENARQAQREADLVLNRIRELHEKPIKGNFDAEHLKGIHAHIFQDLPQHQPGVVRDDTTESWIKHRALEGSSAIYEVHYASQGIEGKITAALEQFGGPEAIKGLSPEAAAVRIADLYGQLDHAHAFYEGNSRTLREFTRELASEAGYTLDWVKTGIGSNERNELYAARDLAVLELAFPDLTPERAMRTNNRAEYEASFVLTGLRRAVGDRPLSAIIRAGLSAEIQHERGGQEHHSGSAAEPALAVFDAVTGVAESLVDFVVGLLSGGSSKPRPEPATLSEMEQIRAERRARAAIERLADSLARGQGFKPEDIQSLTPNHLENIKARGDAYVIELVRRAERERERYNDYGRER
jgi:fido (protein-threonine AMPylation protein)